MNSLFYKLIFLLIFLFILFPNTSYANNIVLKSNDTYEVTMGCNFIETMNNIKYDHDNDYILLMIGEVLLPGLNKGGYHIEYPKCKKNELVEMKIFTFPNGSGNEIAAKMAEKDYVPADIIELTEFSLQYGDKLPKDGTMLFALDTIFVTDNEKIYSQYVSVIATSELDARLKVTKLLGQELYEQKTNPTYDNWVSDHVEIKHNF